MSDFGAVWEYALQLENAMPEAALAKLEEFRPPTLGPTRREREAAAKAAPPAPPAPAAADDKRR